MVVTQINLKLIELKGIVVGSRVKYELIVDKVRLYWLLGWLRLDSNNCSVISYYLNLK